MSSTDTKSDQDRTSRVIERNALLVALSSPSGAGKSTLARRLLAEDAGFQMSVSATTRPKRPGEVEGVDYFFYTDEQFRAGIDAGEFLEHAEVFGHRYGTPRLPVEEALADGKDVLFDVDWQGAQQLRISHLGGAAVQIFILPPSIASLEERLRGRGQDSDEVIRDRMAKARSEISHWAEYGYVLINDNLEQCFSQVCTIIAAERSKQARQPGLFGFVNGLYAEFERYRVK